MYVNKGVVKFLDVINVKFKERINSIISVNYFFFLILIVIRGVLKSNLIFF